MGRLRWVITGLLGAAVLIGGAWLVLVKFEGEKPALTLVPEGKYVSQKLSFQAQDQKSGIAEVRLEVVQDGKTTALVQEQYAPGTAQVEKVISLRPLPQGLKEGEAQVRLSARDHSWNRGNPVTLERIYIIDTQPPKISVSGGQHYANQGGAGFVAYQSSEEVPRSGVQIGETFFPGFPAGKDRYTAYFAVSQDAPAKTPASVAAEDMAGNRTQVSIPLVIKGKTFKHDQIQISENFLKNIIPYFKEQDPKLQGEAVDIFLHINQKQRLADHEQIQKICQATSPTALWSGPFIGLPNGKNMAGFGEVRTYWYNGRKIDQQVHLGIDLASVSQASIPAANSGKVVFAGPLGIYGNTVVIDHGGGVFSMYAHLSRIETEVNRDIKKGEPLGRTGITGLAVGDHLHFSILVHGVFVNPIEWLDPNWIRDNIEKKLTTG